MPYFYLAIAIASEVIATSALKACDGFRLWFPSLLVVAGYASAFFFLALTLRSIAIGVVYAIWSGAGIVLISAVGYWFYGQRLDTVALLGMGLIMAGVLVLYLGSNTLAR